jgi:hypothetical protein
MKQVVFMKRIDKYRKLLGVTKAAELSELKTVYRNLIKEWHPDKFHSEPDLKVEAEEKSKHIIEAYHFLVSIAPETVVNTLPEYTETTNTSPVTDIQYEKMILQITFANGSSYEYFGVPKDLYIKLVNAPTPGRFARRHIYHQFVYRRVSNVMAA